MDEDLVAEKDVDFVAEEIDEDSVAGEIMRAPLCGKIVYEGTCRREIPWLLKKTCQGRDG